MAGESAAFWPDELVYPAPQTRPSPRAWPTNGQGPFFDTEHTGGSRERRDDALLPTSSPAPLSISTQSGGHGQPGRLPARSCAGGRTMPGRPLNLRPDPRSSCPRPWRTSPAPLVSVVTAWEDGKPNLYKGGPPRCGGLGPLPHERYGLVPPGQFARPCAPSHLPSAARPPCFVSQNRASDSDDVFNRADGSSLARRRGGKRGLRPLAARRGLHRRGLPDLF